jgi:hypothetical protein
MSFLEEFVRKTALASNNVHIRLASDDTATPFDEIVREAAFKRGFHHGVIMLMEAVAQYLPPEALANLRRYEVEIFEWRRTRRESFPPEPGILLKSQPS